MRREYEAALHAMQSGVAMTRQRDIEDGVPEDRRETGPKHLRVGVNSAMSDHGALVRLLIAKGLFTEDEYVDEVIAGMQREQRSYEARLSERVGVKITLG